MRDGVIGKLITAGRLFALVLHVCTAVGIVVVVFPCLAPSGHQRLYQWWFRITLRILGITVKASGSVPTYPTTSALFVANHISWLDILLLNAVLPLRFIAKSEIAEWPVLGWLARRTGTIFLSRTSPRSMLRTCETLRQSFKLGACVALFPEGTTTNGRYLASFRTGLFQAAVDGKIPVWPVAIRYTGRTDAALDAVAFVGDMSLLQSLTRILRQPVLVGHLDFAAPIFPCHINRRLLARTAREAVASNLNIAVGLPTQFRRIRPGPRVDNVYA